MRPFLFFLPYLPSLTLAKACTVHNQAGNLDVKACQQNRSIPTKLFREGFCRLQLQNQKVEVAFAEGCPTGIFGVRCDTRIPDAPHWQDIFYHGIATDARYLESFCASQS